MDRAYSDEINWKRPALLALAVVIAGSLVYWYEYSYSPKLADRKDSEEKLFTPMDAQIASIKVVTEGKAVILQCQDMDKNLCRSSDVSHWKMTEPLTTAADRSNVVGLLSTLQSVQTTETLDLTSFDTAKKSALLKEYQLDEASRNRPEATRIELELKDGKKKAIYIGAPLALEGNLYALVKMQDSLNENRIWVVSNYFLSSLSKPLSYWRDKKIFDWSVAQIASARLQAGNTSLLASKDSASDRWKISENKRAAVNGDADQIEAWLNSVVTLMAKDFFSEDKTSPEAKTLLSKAKKILSIHLLKKEVLDSKSTPSDLALEISLFETGQAPQPKLNKLSTRRIFLTVSSLPQVFEVEVSASERLKKTYADLRQSKLLSYQDRFAVKKVQFNFLNKQARSGSPDASSEASPEASPEASLDAGKWNFTAKNLGNADHNKIQSLMDRLVNLRVRKVHSGKMPLKPLLALQLKNETGAILHEIRFGKNEKSAYAELPSGAQEYFELDPIMVNEIPTSVDQLQAPGGEANVQKKE